MRLSRGWRALLIAGTIAGLGLATLGALRAASAAILRRDEARFAVCFAPPRLAPPPPEIHARVAAYDGELDRFLSAGDPPAFRGFARAIVTHESGGDPRAISPTGCAGLVAISAPPPGYRACCEVDDGDGSLEGYDRCNSEAANGYRCSPDDPRFTPAYSMAFVADRFRRIHQVIAANRRGGPAADPRVVVPLAWNAGLGVFRPFSSAMRSERSALEHLDFSGKPPYPTFRVRGHANKIVEIYDYLAWFRFLSEYWEGGTPGAPEDTNLVCVDYAGGANRVATLPPGLRAALIRRIAVPTAIRRLAFGRYEPATVYFAAGPLRPLVWRLAAAFA
ncbi:MAG TPA: hypothetical protein VNK41_05675 [Vicinamibacterales bacterium]|nr:hypothetical protein [Vicinamibacterales bacterium]